MPTKAEKLAYARKLRQIERRFGLLERDTLQRSIAFLRNFRNQVAGQLTQIENFEQFRLRELRRNLEELIAFYIQSSVETGVKCALFSAQFKEQ